MCLLGIKIKQSLVDFGPQKIRLAGIFGPSYKIMWDQAPSCYNIQGFQFVVLKSMHDYLSYNLNENNEIAFFSQFIDHKWTWLSFSKTANGQIIKDFMLDEVQDWVFLDNLEGGTEYTLQLYTLYGDDKNNSIRSVPSNFTFVSECKSF